MKAELIAVGTEILLGDIVNTDAQVISQGLSELGIDVYYQTVVGDNPERLKQVIEQAKSRADIIITTGGLGPTLDDLTKETLAQVFGKKLVLHEESLAH
ncbi:MAG: molybdopterin-binding protein, partial [Butyricicoccus sp.]